MPISKLLQLQQSHPVFHLFRSFSKLGLDGLDILLVVEKLFDEISVSVEVGLGHEGSNGGQVSGKSFLDIGNGKLRKFLKDFRFKHFR